MKKILSLMLFIWVFCFFGMVSVKAINMTVSSNTVTAGDSFTINFSDAKISMESPLYEFSYDNMSNLEKVGNPVGFSGFDRLSFTATSGSITFKAKEVKTDYTVNFQIKDLNNEEIKTVSVNVKTKQAPVVTPSIPTPEVTPAPKSNNANLKALEIRGNDDSEVILSPNFSSSVYEYQATVDATVKTILINPTPEDSKANVVISNNAMDELKAGENNQITITVTAEDGTKKAYVVNVKREALTADAFLKSLTVKESKDFKFKEDKFSYNVKVASSVNRLTLDYETSSEDAVVNINGNMNLKNGSKVKILVTAEDGTKKEYVLNIVKETKTTKKVSVNVTAEKNPLVIMALSMVGFGLIGAIIYVIKK